MIRKKKIYVFLVDKDLNPKMGTVRQFSHQEIVGALLHLQGEKKLVEELGQEKLNELKRRMNGEKK